LQPVFLNPNPPDSGLPNPDPGFLMNPGPILVLGLKLGRGNQFSKKIQTQKMFRRISQPSRKKLQLFRCEILRGNFGLLVFEFNDSHLNFLDLEYCILY
jgi:hypothetical protein